MGKYYNKCLNDEFNDYGNIESMILYGSFKDEALNDVKTFTVKTVYSILISVYLMLYRRPIKTCKQHLGVFMAKSYNKAKLSISLIS